MQTHASVGLLALRICHLRLPLQVLKSVNGFYIGTADIDGPCSRESEEYWELQSDAENALATGRWTQKGILE